MCLDETVTQFNITRSSFSSSSISSTVRGTTSCMAMQHVLEKYDEFCSSLRSVSERARDNLRTIEFCDEIESDDVDLENCFGT